MSSAAVIPTSLDLSAGVKLLAGLNSIKFSSLTISPFFIDVLKYKPLLALTFVTFSSEDSLISFPIKDFSIDLSYSLIDRVQL